MDKISVLLTKKVESFLKITDNFDLLSELDSNIEDNVEHLCNNLIDYETIDKLTFTDTVVEENRKLLLNSMTVRYAHKDKSISSYNAVGKGIKESTSVNFLRLYMMNRLENRKGFIKANIRLQVINEIDVMWDSIKEGFSQKLLDLESELIVSNSQSRSKLTQN